MSELVERTLAAAYPSELVGILLCTYADALDHLRCGRIRACEQEAGRFCEAIVRMLQEKTSGIHTPLDKSLPALDKWLTAMAGLPSNQWDDGIRIHMPRAIHMIYGIRSRRNVSHLGSVDTSRMDADLVVTIMKWILSELFRLESNNSGMAAQSVVAHIMEREMPMVQEFNGTLKLLDQSLSVRDQVLSALFHRAAGGMARVEIAAMLRPKHRPQLSSVLSRLKNEKNYIHLVEGRYVITAAGERYVEKHLIEASVAR